MRLRGPLTPQRTADRGHIPRRGQLRGHPVRQITPPQPQPQQQHRPGHTRDKLARTVGGGIPPGCVGRCGCSCSCACRCTRARHRSCSRSCSRCPGRCRSRTCRCGPIGPCTGPGSRRCCDAHPRTDSGTCDGQLQGLKRAWGAVRAGGAARGPLGSVDHIRSTPAGRGPAFLVSAHRRRPVAYAATAAGGGAAVPR